MILFLISFDNILITAHLRPTAKMIDRPDPGQHSLSLPPPTATTVRILLVSTCNIPNILFLIS